MTDTRQHNFNSDKILSSMKKSLFTILLASVATFAFSQLNMTLLDEINYGINANDVWGYVDPVDSTEYALVGLRDGLSIVDLTDPTNVVEIKKIPGPQSTWRDIKSWGNFVYVTNETSNGLLVVDMSNAPNISDDDWFEWSPNIPGLGQFNSSHNLYIDEFGYLYLSGSNLNSGGMVIIDVNTDPGNPMFVSAAPAIYSHDVYVRGNKMFASEIYAGNLSIYDVSDKQNITLLGSQQTPFNFTHNSWLNDAGDVVFTTDEKANAPVAAYDISDLNDIKELDQFIPISTMGQNVIPHNVHVWDDWLIISYYTDGGIIADASKPDNIIEVGNWDTFLGGNGGFSGVWGAYPFLPSGLVLLTDIGTGLYVCGADYVRACWLEGTVTNEITGAAILGAEASIDAAQANFATSDLIGEYKTGLATAGTYDVTFSATGYYPKTVQATLENGVLTILDVQLQPFSSFTVAGQTVKATDGTAVPGATIVLQGDQNYSFTSDGNGNFTLSNITIGEYTLYAGAWGYMHEVISNLMIDDQTGSITITLDPGYQDDFILDQGWTATGDASTGLWERGKPIGTDYQGSQSNPGEDISGDIGDQCYVTGNGGNDAGFDDVDNGTVTLTSPSMDLTNYADPVLSYYTWFFNEGGNGTPDDALQVRVNNGTDEVILETITTSNSFWNAASTFHLSDYLAVTNNMQVIFETSDLPTSGHLVEAAVDAFLVEDAIPYPAFLNTGTEGCSPFTVLYTDQSDSTATWSWAFEGGEPAVSSEQNPIVVYNNSGTYNVTLEVTTNAGNTYTINRPNSVVIGATPTAEFSSSVTGAVVNFTNMSTGNGDYFWDFGDGETSNSDQPSHTYDMVGTYTVTLTTTNDCGTVTTTQDVTILAIAPTASFSMSGTQGCTPFTVEFTDLSTGVPDSWEWEFEGGDPATSTDQHPTVVYNSAGTYTVTLNVTNAAGTSQAIQTNAITIGTSPTAEFSINANGPEITLTNTSVGDTFDWMFGDGTTSTEMEPTHSYADLGEYEVTLTVTNDCGTVVYTQTVNITSLTSTFELDESAFNMSVSPNPFQEAFFLNYKLLGNFDQAQVTVYNVLGEQLSTVELNAANGSIVMGQEIRQSGVYFLRLVVDGKAGKAVRIVRL